MIVLNQIKNEFIECDSIRIGLEDDMHTIEARKNDGVKTVGFFVKEESAQKALLEMFAQAEKGKTIIVPPSDEKTDPEVEALRKMIQENSPPKSENIDFEEIGRQQMLEVMLGVDQDAERKKRRELKYQKTSLKTCQTNDCKLTVKSNFNKKNGSFAVSTATLKKEKDLAGRSRQEHDEEIHKIISCIGSPISCRYGNYTCCCERYDLHSSNRYKYDI